MSDDARIITEAEALQKLATPRKCPFGLRTGLIRWPCTQDDGHDGRCVTSLGVRFYGPQKGAAHG